MKGSKMLIEIKNAIEEHRKLRMPPCTECKYFTKQDAYGWCECNAYLDYVARVRCMFIDSSDVRNVRGTKYCRFEQKQEND